ncbi:g-type lysozyme inhibitor [bacterium]|nr:MAG: g-type lysozyme inhibitor [bacterium]
MNTLCITRLFAVAAASAILSTAPSAFAQSGVKSEKIAFKKGSNTAKKSGTVKGDGTVRYLIAAKSGAKLSVSLKSKSTFVYFNILDPKTGFALESNGAVREVTQWSGKLPSQGTYILQVYLVRPAARRGQSAKFDLTLKMN